MSLFNDIMEKHHAEMVKANDHIAELERAAQADLLVWQHALAEKDVEIERLRLALREIGDRAHLYVSAKDGSPDTFPGWVIGFVDDAITREAAEAVSVNYAVQSSGPLMCRQ